MANQFFNVAKGRPHEFWRKVVGNDPANSAIIGILLKTTAADATLIDLDTVADILAGSSVEADFTNYARKVWTDADLSNPTVDDTNDRVDGLLTDWVIANAGGASNNTLVKIILAYDNDTTGGTDANLVPILHADLSQTTNGDQLTVKPTTASIAWRAT